MTISLATLRALARKSCDNPTIEAQTCANGNREVHVFDEQMSTVLIVYGRTEAEAHAMAAAALAARAGR